MLPSLTGQATLNHAFKDWRCSFAFSLKNDLARDSTILELHSKKLQKAELCTILKTAPQFPSDCQVAGFFELGFKHWCLITVF